MQSQKVTDLATRHVHRTSVAKGAFALMLLLMLLVFAGVLGNMRWAFASEAADETKPENQTEVAEHLLSTEGFDRPVHYQIAFDAAGGQGEMPAWDVNIAPIDTSARQLPACAYTCDGWRFSHWITVVPELCKLKPARLEDCQQLLGFSWESASAREQTGWSGPLTLQSFADESKRIVLKAVWQNNETGALSEEAQRPRRTSSTSVRTLYRYNSGYYGYLSTGSAPSGYGGRTALTVVPTSSSTPVYMLHNPYETIKYHFTMSASEYNRLGGIGWTRQGVAFYSDDAQGITVYRFYRPASDAHSYALTSRLSGYNDEGISCYGVKYYYAAYNGNGATSGSYATQKLQYGLTYTMPKNPYSWPDHTFTGWYCSNGATYSAGQAVSNLTATSEGTVTMYAQWKISCYRVSFNANGGEGAYSPPGVVTGPDYVVRDPGCPFTRPGYVFAGWNTRPDGKGIQLAPKGSAVMQGNSVAVTLYAQWAPLQLAMSVPATIELLADAQGNVSAGQVCSIENSGIRPLALSTMKVDAAAGWDVVSGVPERGQIALEMQVDVGEDEKRTIKLGDCLGDSPPTSLAANLLDIPAGESLAVSFAGRCGPSEGTWQEGAVVARISWGFRIPEAKMGFVVQPDSDPLVQAANAGDSITVPACPASSAGLRFTGWNTNELGEGETYQPGDTLTLQGDTTLFAQWV